MQEADDLILMLVNVGKHLKDINEKVPRSVLKFYAYLAKDVKEGKFEEKKLEKLYMSCEASLLDLVREEKLTFDSQQMEEEWFAKMDDLKEKILSKDEIEQEGRFNSKQREFLNDKGAWLEKEVLKCFETETEFKITPETWGFIQKNFGFGGQKQFYRDVLEDISERVGERLKSSFRSHGETFFAELVEKLKKLGVLFLDKSYYFIAGIAHYYPEKKAIMFRTSKFDTGYNYITNKHELIHAAFYNLPKDMQEDLRKLVEIELTKIKSILDELEVRQPHILNVLGHKYDVNLTYALSSSDELLAYLSHPSFVQLIRDLENDNLFPKGFWKKVKEKISKKEKFKTRLFEIENEVYRYYR